MASLHSSLTARLSNYFSPTSTDGLFFPSLWFHLKLQLWDDHEKTRLKQQLLHTSWLSKLLQGLSIRWVKLNTKKNAPNVMKTINKWWVLVIDIILFFIIRLYEAKLSSRQLVRKVRICRTLIKLNKYLLLAFSSISSVSAILQVYQILKKDFNNGDLVSFHKCLSYF